MSPALAHGSVLVCEARRALTVASAATDRQTKWNWSNVSQMSPPAPWTVHVPPLSVWFPTTVGLPTSAQLHPLGQGLAEGGGAGAGPRPAIATPSNDAVDVVPAVPEATATPVSAAVGRTTVIVEPGTSVHEAPSGDVAALSTSPVRWIIRWKGGAGAATVTAPRTAPPGVVRYCTVSPFGVRST